MNILEKITNKSVKIGVVGLPLGLEFADKQYPIKVVVKSTEIEYLIIICYLLKKGIE